MNHLDGQNTFLKADTEKEIANGYHPDAEAIIFEGDSAETLKTLPDESVKLVITSPPYNIGKVYEEVTHLKEYLENLTPVVDQLIRVLAPDGSLCWQVGNYVEKGEILPLDIFYYPYFKKRGLRAGRRWSVGFRRNGSKPRRVRNEDRGRLFRAVDGKLGKN